MMGKGGKNNFSVIVYEDIMDNGFVSLTSLRTFYNQDLDKTISFIYLNIKYLLGDWYMYTMRGIF